MPTSKHLKRLVRARMAETGEKYTTALAALQALRPAAETTEERATPQKEPADAQAE